MSNNVLVVAFDGLDKELVEKYDLQNVVQEESGTIDNDTGMYARKTSELFTSFITGETFEEHGVKGLVAPASNNTFLEKFESKYGRVFGLHKFQELRKAVYDSIRHIDYSFNEVRPYKYHLDIDTLFDLIPDSRDLFVPGYSKNWGFICGNLMNPIFNGASSEETVKYNEREFHWRKKKLFESLDQPFDTGYDFLMCHFHRVDLAQHMYASNPEKEEELENVYNEVDALAGKIKDEAETNYDYIIFMSDHGVPTKKSHNKNAFYSCNRKLFGGKEPRITDFFDKILRLTGSSNKASTGLNGFSRNELVAEYKLAVLESGKEFVGDAGKLKEEIDRRGVSL